MKKSTDNYAAWVRRYRAWVPRPVRMIVGFARNRGPTWRRTDAVEGAWNSHAYTPRRWDREYRAQDWQYLDSLFELPRYSLISGYAQHFRPGGTLLDLGCGEGILARHMQQVGGGPYLGVDISAVAIDRARARGSHGCSFVCADIAAFVPDRRYDIIVFNEVLYYLSDAPAVMRRYEDFMAPGGVLIVCMFADARTLENWRTLERAYRFDDETTACNVQSGQRWSCRVVRPT